MNIDLSSVNPVIRDELFVGVLLFAFAFFSFRKSDTSSLLAAILVGGIAWIGYNYILQKNTKLEEERNNSVAALNKDIKERESQAVSAYQDKYYVGKFPKKGLKYLVENSGLVDIATSLRPVRVFDKSRYADLLHLMNVYQKTYMYILMDRYDATVGLDTFIDLGDSILENMYSLVFVLPDRFKHIYGVDPDALVQDNVRRFTVMKRQMTDVLESYVQKELGIRVVPMSLPRASDVDASARQLP